MEVVRAALQGEAGVQPLKQEVQAEGNPAGGEPLPVVAEAATQYGGSGAQGSLFAPGRADFGRVASGRQPPSPGGSDDRKGPCR
jgi:hypothetical protein